MRRPFLTALLLLAFVLQAGTGNGIRWLALFNTPSALALNQTQHCKQLEGLVVSQVQLCRSNLELMRTIIQAAREVIKTCRKSFSDMRWNCSSIERAPNYLLDLERGTRESAFVYALSAAAISHTIARACTTGDLPGCSCGPIPVPEGLLGDEVQVSRGVRFLLHQDVLEGASGPEGRRPGPKEQIPVGHQGGPSAHGHSEAPGAQGTGHPPSEGDRAGLPAELSRFLHEEREGGILRDAGQALQQNLQRQRQLRLDVLRPWLQPLHGQGGGALPLQVPLVLLRHLQEVRADRREIRVQVRLPPRLAAASWCPPGETSVPPCFPRTPQTRRGGKEKRKETSLQGNRGLIPRSPS